MSTGTPIRLKKIRLVHDVKPIVLILNRGIAGSSLHSSYASDLLIEAEFAKYNEFQSKVGGQTVMSI